jgi:hypothetical protein
MAVNNNTTISADISGAGINVEAVVRLTASVTEEFVQPSTAQFKRRLNNGSWISVGPTFTLTPQQEAWRIVQTVSYRDTSVIDQNNYHYYLEIDATLQDAGAPQ